LKSYQLSAKSYQLSVISYQQTDTLVVLWSRRERELQHAELIADN
jgi:hypothetical protein